MGLAAKGLKGAQKNHLSRGKSCIAEEWPRWDDLALNLRRVITVLRNVATWIGLAGTSLPRSRSPAPPLSPFCRIRVSATPPNFIERRRGNSPDWSLSMSLIGKIALLAFAVGLAILAYVVSKLELRLRGRQPCRRWVAFVAGDVASAIVFSVWTGVYGLSAASPGLGGAAFGAFGGLVSGGFFSYIHAKILWNAFDANSAASLRSHELEDMHTDVRVLLARMIGKVRSFRPHPEFANTGILPWTIFLAAIILPMIWSYAFCLLAWMTEGAPGVKPVMPIQR